MTTYRLLNNVFDFKEAFVDFKMMRKNYTQLRVGFNEDNISLYDNLKSKWQPVDVSFDKSSNGKKDTVTPDLSVWNMSCLVLSEKATNALNTFLEPYGEFLPLNNGYSLFNCLTSIDTSCVDGSQSSFEMEFTGTDTNELLGNPKKLVLLDSALKGKEIFKPGFSYNSFLICQDSFKSAVEKSMLGGLIFEQDLAQIFPRKLLKV